MCCSASQTKYKLIGVKSLDQLFEQNNWGSNHNIQVVCEHCGCDVEIKITKTSVGYGIQGGALYESNSEKFCLSCPNCYQKHGEHK